MIFISYSSRDYDTVLTIWNVLVNNCIESWITPESIPINVENRVGYGWFFERKSEKAELVDLIMRYELD